MRTRRLGLVFVLTAFHAATFMPRIVRGDFLFFAGNPSGYQKTLVAQGIQDSNVLFNGAGLIETGPMVQGRILMGGVLDLSSDETLVTAASGQAMVMATDGDFTRLRFYLDNPFQNFEALSFDVNPMAKASGLLTLALTDLGGSVQQASIELAPGLTFFGVVATDGSLFSSAILSGGVPIHDVRQIRLADPGTGAAAPPSLVLIGIGLALLVSARSLRRWIRLPAP